MNLLLSATILIILLFLFRYNKQRETFEVDMGSLSGGDDVQGESSSGGGGGMFGDGDVIDYLPEDCVDGCTVYCDKPEGCKGEGHHTLRPDWRVSATVRSEIIIVEWN